MTWINTDGRASISTTLLDTINGAPNYVVGDVVKFSRLNKGGSDYFGPSSVAYNATTGTISLGDKPHFLWGALTYYIGTSTASQAKIITYFTTQWYDVTNGQYIGAKGRLWSYRFDHYVLYSDGIQADEAAVAYARNIDVQLHIVAPVVKNGFTLQFDVALARHNKSRALIMELG